MRNYKERKWEKRKGWNYLGSTGVALCVRSEKEEKQLDKKDNRYTFKNWTWKCQAKKKINRKFQEPRWKLKGDAKTNEERVKLKKKIRNLRTWQKNSIRQGQPKKKPNTNNTEIFGIFEVNIDSYSPPDGLLSCVEFTGKPGQLVPRLHLEKVKFYCYRYFYQGCGSALI